MDMLIIYTIAIIVLCTITSTLSLLNVLLEVAYCNKLLLYTYLINYFLCISYIQVKLGSNRLELGIGLIGFTLALRY